MKIQKMLERQSISVVVWIKMAALLMLCLLAVMREPNVMPQWIYFTLIGITFGLQTALISKRHGDSIIIFWNYALIAAMLWGKGVEGTLNSFLLCYPLLEALIFPRAYYVEKWRLLIGCVLCSAIVYSFYLSSPDKLPPMPFLILVIEAMLWWAFLFKATNIKWNNIEEDMSDKIDEYFRSHNIVEGTHKVYRQLITDWNKRQGDLRIRDISTYKLSHDTFILVNSAWFKWDRELNVDASETARLQGLSSVQQTEYLGKKSGKEIWHVSYIVPLEVGLAGDERRLYAVRYDLSRERKFLYHEKLCMHRVLNQLSWRIVNIVALANRMHRQEKDYVESYKRHKDYVDKAVGTLHYIRNRLSSFANLIEYYNLPQAEQEAIPKSYHNDMIKAVKNDCAGIHQYAEKMLNREHYPFSDMEAERIHVQQIYTFLSEIVESQLGVMVKVENDADPGHKYVSGNSFEINTILTDWVSNMRKYGRDYEVHWMLRAGELEIAFRNSREEAGTNSLKSVAEDLKRQTPETQHTRRQTFGIMQIRHYVAKNNLGLEAEVEQSEGGEERLSVKVKFALIDEKNIGN